jgi:hypothetical protein
MSSAPGQVKLVGLDDLARLLIPDETVGGVSTTLKPLRCRLPSPLEVSSGTSPGLVFTVEADSEVSVFAFNTPKDRDPDLILVPPGTSAGEAGPIGQLELVSGCCWLVLRYAASAGADSTGTLAAASLGPEAGAPVLLSDYRRHERAENAARAVAEDLLHLRSALCLADVQALRPGEALALQTFVTLRMILEVSWSDVLAGGLGTLAGVVGAVDPLSVELSPTATVLGSVTVTDEFSVVFSRLQNGRTRVAVRKPASRAFAATGSQCVAAELTDPQQVELALQETVTGLLGEAYTTIRALAEKASLSELSDLERTAGEALTRRFGLGELADCFTTLQQKLRELEGAIGEAIADLATTRLTSGFAYELDRLGPGSTVVEVVLDPDTLIRHHAFLCDGNLEAVIGAIRDGSAGVALVSCLRRRTLERTHGPGFALANGPWSALGRQRRALGRVLQQDTAGRQKVSCLGLGVYEGRWLGDVADWVVDLCAGMPRFAEGLLPSLSEFELGLQLAWHWRQGRLEADELELLVDTALLWRVFEREQATTVRQRLAPLLGRSVELTVQVRFDDPPFCAVLEAAAAGRDADFAAALAAAMPWRKGSPGRADPVCRRDLYGPLWAHALEQPDATARELVALARQYLATGAEPQLVFLEENYLRLTPTCTFVGLAKVANQDTATAWRDFRSGARLLREASITAPVEETALESAFALMANLWAQAHHVRALGAFLLDAASAAGVAYAVTRTLTVLTRDGGNETAVVVAAPTT